MSVLTNLVQRVEMLRRRMEQQPMQWDSSAPMFFLLEDALSAASAQVAEELMAEAATNCRKQLAEIK